MPTVVIRTTGCTHRCWFGDGGWCDSWYTSIHPEKGKYTLKIEPGNYTLVFSFVGYESVEVAITAKANETLTINKALGSGGYKLEDVKIQKVTNREKETALLQEQKKAIEIKQSIGAQEMSRKGVSDVEEGLTKITGISWQFGKTGRVTPVAIMEPVDLDGTTVTRASLCNLGFLKAKGAVIGSIVSIAKAGDIIPQIQNVISTPSEIVIEHPTQCKCGFELVIKDIHLLCINPQCSEKARFKFHHAVNVLGLDGVGGTMINSLWDAGYRNALELLDTTKTNKASLIKAGIKNSKTLDNMLTEIAKITDIRPIKIILAMGVEGMGNTVAKELEKLLTGQTYSFHGLQKDVIAGFEEGGIKRERYQELYDYVSNFVNIILPEVISAESIPFEMSGSPKAFGYKTKDEFVAAAKLKGYHHTSLSSAKVLFVEDVNNLSGKIKAAQAKGIKILGYSDIK
jgi:predicted Zn-ribbon and HTH transcriptional regulator